MSGEKTFIEKTQPVNILEVMRNDLLEQLIDSYCLVSKTGVAVYYPTKLPASLENLTLFMLENPERLEPLNFAFCRSYRDPMGRWKYDDICQSEDKRIVLKYYNGDWLGPKLFHCYLGMWEMTYPLRAQKRLLGVVYGGQIVVTETVHDWREALRSVIDELVWVPFGEKEREAIPEMSNQVEEIAAAIKDNDRIREGSRVGLSHLFTRAVDDEPATVNSLLDRYEKFKKFGSVLESVLEDLFTAKVQAALREHIHGSSRDIANRGEHLSEEPKQFWNGLDEVVQATLPNVRGYVLFRLDEYRAAYNPERTCIYDKGLISSEPDFRTFCRHMFDELHESGEKKRSSIIYDFLDEKVPQVFRDLAHRGIKDWNKVADATGAIALPLAEIDGKIAGGLVCVTAKAEQPGTGGRRLSEDSLKIYIEATEDILEVLAMVFARQAVVEAQASAWAARSHELVAPITAVMGYNSNIRYIFSKHIEPLTAVGNGVKEMLEARISRLGKLCDLLIPIATSGSIKGGVRFTKANLTKEVFLPIVQPLRDYGEQQNDVLVFFDEEMFKIPELFLYVDGLRRCVFNLVFNAIKYSNNRTTVYLNMEQTTDDYHIRVVNEGIGVMKVDEERIFHRFTQGSNAYKATGYGAGLGLYVARQMARIHGGEVSLVSGDPKNTIFSLTLPKSLQLEPPTRSDKEYQLWKFY
jgi:signal transduction histidine kinase/ligand-binding sensor protein